MQLDGENIEFTETNSRYLADTFKNAVWQPPQQLLATYVDGTLPSADYSHSLAGWLELAAIDPQVWTIANTVLHNADVRNGSAADYPATFAKMFLYDPSRVAR